MLAESRTMVMPLQVLAASGSAFRRSWYQEQLERCGIEVATAINGLDCIEQMRALQPDVVLLEPSLLWGGSQGVLAVRSTEFDLQKIPIVLVAVDGVSAEWYQLADYALQGLLLRYPSAQELVDTIRAAAHESCEA